MVEEVKQKTQMPGSVYHAWEIHLSFAVDITGSWTKELLHWCTRNALWYAIKHELGENGKVHIHMVIIYEIQTALGTKSAGAKTKDRVLSQMTFWCPQIKQYLIQYPSPHNIVMAPLKSDELIATYMQKESELAYKDLPLDLCELKPYFADLQTVKPKNPEYDHWAKLYKDDNCIMPATLESVWNFFGHHMYAECDHPIKILSDPKRLKERVMSTMLYINKVAPDFEMIFGGKRQKLMTHDPKERPRFCPRCQDKDRDAPNILEPREQFCAMCKNY